MEKPFQINSVSIPLMGNNYLDDHMNDHWANDYDPGLSSFINRIVDSGADSAKFIITSVMNRSTDNNFDQNLTNSYNPSNEKIEKFAHTLQSRGLDIEINPLVVIANRDNQNNIIADKINPINNHAWMKSYSEEMLKWAALAEKIGAKRITLFTDVEQHMTWKPELVDGWVKLAADIKQVFSGHLTATSWMDGNSTYQIDATSEQIWRSLDSIGVQPFPEPLTNLSDPTVDQLVSGWYENAIGAQPVEFFKNLAERFDRPVYFNDRTFRSVDGTNINEAKIWQSTIPLKSDLQEQADLFESFFRVFSHEQGDWLLGISFNSITRINDRPIDSPSRYLKGDVGEDWEGKPAGDVLASWYKGLRQTEGKLFYGDTEIDKNDRIIGGYHHDSLEGGLGNDFLNGGAGRDTAIFSGPLNNYIISVDSTTTVRDLSAARDGTDTLISIERIKFTDTHVALDIENIAGKAYRLYKAAFDRTPDLKGLGYWINDMDRGVTLETVSSGFMASDEFILRYGANVSDNDFIKLLYENVLDRQPDQTGYEYWQRDMANGMSREKMLINFSESFENKANVSELISNGIQYTKYESPGNYNQYSSINTYVGEVDFLQFEIFGTESQDILVGSLANDFMVLQDDDDAADGRDGMDVLDGGLGSNFLTGGAGADTFFLDGRSGARTWSTITDFSLEDSVNIWGWQQDVSSLVLAFDDQGAEGYRGATLHYDLNGDRLIDTSITFAGLTLASISTPTVEEISGNGYLLFA